MNQRKVVSFSFTTILIVICLYGVQVGRGAVDFEAAEDVHLQISGLDPSCYNAPSHCAPGEAVNIHRRFFSFGTRRPTSTLYQLPEKYFKVNFTIS